MVCWRCDGVVDIGGRCALGAFLTSEPGELVAVTVERTSGRPGQTTALPPDGLVATVGGGQDFRFARI